MNTSSMYINKFSTGTILALLALSGMLFLVPLAGPVHATQNASLPTFTVGTTAYIVATGTAGTTLKIANPITNSYAFTSITIFAPSGFAFVASTGAVGSFFTTESVATVAAETFTGSLPPGFADTVTLGTITASTLSPATAAPPTGTFTTTLIDGGSSPASYPGPTWVAYDVATGTAVVVTASATTFTAGGSPITITASDTTGQSGVPFTFKVTTPPVTPGFTASVSPTSGVTGSTGTTTTSFSPSNHATDSTTITATIGGGAGALTAQSAAIVTFAGAVSKVTFYLGFPTLFPATHYVTTNVGVYADIGASTVTYAATDAFGNAAGGAVTGGTLTAANGFFAALTTETSCTALSVAVGGCGGYSVVPEYSQSGTYGTIGQIGATLTGTGFSVSGTTGFIQTSTFASAASFQWPSAPISVGAGSSTSPKILALSPVQTGVPIKIQICTSIGCTTTKGYSGTFSSGASISGVTNSSGSFGAAFAVSTALGATVQFNATISKPVDNSAVPQFFTSSNSPVITTIPGAPASLAVYATFLSGQGSGNSGRSTNFATSGATLYVDAILTDAYGNVVPNTLSQQVQVTLVAAGGLLSATQIYISSNCASTNETTIVGSCLGSFGPVSWTLPTTLGASTVSATAVVAGKAVAGSITVTTISPLPTITVTTPKPVSGVIYSSSPFVTFAGKANASAGYPSSPTLCTTPYVCITSIGYKVNAAHWISASVASNNKVVWSVPVTLPTGLSTIAFNATDNKGNVGIPTVATYQVLVDSVAPTLTFAGTTSNTGCEVVTAATAAGDFNEATTGTGAFTATYGGVAVPAANIAFSGTQTLGTAGSVTATVCGLTTQTATLIVTGSTLAGLSSTASESLTVTVPFADSISFTTGSATFGTVGAYQGITVPVTNSWNTAQIIVVFATFKSGTSIYVAQGTTTLAPGQTASVFAIDLQTVPAGSYTVTFAAVTTSNLPVSAPTTGITVVT